MKNGTPNALISILICLVYLVLIVSWPYPFEWTLIFFILIAWKFSILTLSIVRKWMHVHYLFWALLKTVQLTFGI